MGARGNSGVILSQIVRGAADVLGETTNGDRRRRWPRVRCAARPTPPTAPCAGRSRGRCCRSIRELAEEAEARAPTARPLGDLLVELVRRGEEARRAHARAARRAARGGRRRRGRRRAVELVRGVAAAVSGEPLPERAAGRGAPERRGDPPGAVALPLLHGLRGRGRGARPRGARGRSSSSSATRCSSSATRPRSRCTSTPTIPARRSRSAPRVGTIDGIEIANMHEQTRAARGAAARVVPDAPPARDDGRRRGRRGRREPRALREPRRASARSDRRGRPDDEPVDRGPARARSQALDADEAIILPNNSNVCSPPSRRPRTPTGRSRSCRRDSIPAGLAAMVAFDGARSARPRTRTRCARRSPPSRRAR